MIEFKLAGGEDVAMPMRMYMCCKLAVRIIQNIMDNFSYHNFTFFVA